MADFFKNISTHKTLQAIGITDLVDNMWVKVFIGLALVVLIVLMFPHGETIPFNYPLGSVWEERDVIAPYSFAITKDVHVYETERQDAGRNVYPIIERNEDIVRTQAESLAIIVTMLREATGAHAKMTKGSSQKDTLSFRTLAGGIPFALTDEEWRSFARWQAANTFEKFQAGLNSILSSVMKKGVLNVSKSKFSQKAFALRSGRTETIVSMDQVLDLDEALNAAQAELATRFTGNEINMLGIHILRAIVRPNLFLNQAETDREAQIAQDNVPRTLGFVQQGEKIIAKNDRITPEVKLKLDSFEQAKAERGAVESDWKHWIGIALHVVLVLTLYGLYIYLFRKRIFHDNGKLTIIALLFLMEAWFTYLSLSVNLSDPSQYLIVVPAASMLLAIIFDSRVAFYGTVTMAFLIAGMRGNDYGIALISLVGGAFGVYTVRDISNRTQIFRSLIFIFLGYAVSILALSIERFDPFDTIATELTYALANSLVSPLLTYGLLMLFERGFKVTTDLTLVELSDFNRPLLKELSEKAPGTFHHSMTIGNLAEAAAEAIGANAILARVGGYYHDIGKMLKPEYFVENQAANQNRHNRLRPRMSALIIAAHVKEGVELGRQYGLPQVVLDFIPQHHGTTRISFFYDKALKQAARRSGMENVNEQDFLYPGPKPQTKETGIVMLADSVEATARSTREMTIQKLENVIENIIRQRFVEGQLDECELTLRDLTKIKEAFMKILLGIHHQRIIYPHQEQIEAPPPAEPPIVPIQQPQIAGERAPAAIPQHSTTVTDAHLQQPDDLPQSSEPESGQKSPQ